MTLGSRIAISFTPNIAMLAAIGQSAPGGLCTQTWFVIQSR